MSHWTYVETSTAWVLAAIAAATATTLIATGMLEDLVAMARAATTRLSRRPGARHRP